jgi:hypothetical protein
MPVYVWFDKNSEKEIEVIRTFDEYQVPPTQEESTLTEEEYLAAKWEKLISSKVMVTRGPNWGDGRKGSW